MKNKKAIMVGMLIKIILGVLILSVLMAGVISKLPGSWNSFSKGVKDISGSDIILSNQTYDESKIQSDQKVALDSLDALKMAINALAENRQVRGTDLESVSNNIKVTFFANFDYEGAGSKWYQCSFPVTTLDTRQSVYCYDQLKNDQGFVGKKPKDISTVFSFAVEVDGSYCGPSEDQKFKGGDLNTYDSEHKKPNGQFEDCKDSSSYIICNGYKVYYCGKQDWTLKVLSEKTNEENAISLKDRAGFFKNMGDIISNGWDALISAIGFHPDKVSRAVCDDGGFVIGSGEHLKCLLCNPTDNYGEGRCSLTGFELPQDVTKETSESWIRGMGDPAFVMYFEIFPTGEDESWKVSEITVLSAGLTVGSIAFDFIPLVGKGASAVFKKVMPEVVTAGLATAKQAIKSGSKRLADETAGRVVSAIKNSLKGITSKSSDEILDAAIRRAMKESPQYVDDAARKFTNQIIKGALDDVAGSVLKSSDGIADDIVKSMKNYIDDSGKLIDKDKFLDDAVIAYRTKLTADLDVYNKYVSDAAYYAEKNADEATRKLAMESGNYDDYFYNMGKKQIDDSVEQFRTKLDEVITAADYENAVKRIIEESLLENQEMFFKSNFRALMSAKGAFYYFDDEIFSKSVGKMDEILDAMPQEARKKLFLKSQKSLSRVIDSNGEIMWKKILGDIDDEGISQMTKSMDELIASGKHDTLLKKTADLMSLEWTGLMKQKGRYVLATTVALYSGWLDAGNEKFTPAGYNTLALSRVSAFESRKIETLSAKATNLFIRLDKEGRDDSFTERFFMVSPCKTDLDIRKQKCTCAVEKVVDTAQGEWVGYLKDTSTETKKQYLPIKNVDVDSNDYEIVNFDRTDTRAGAIEAASFVFNPYGELINQIDLKNREIKFPVLKNNVDITYAVKDCPTRSWWDSEVFIFDNVDVETDCVSISETDTARTKYSSYNNGYNFCYAGDNMVADVLKVGIIAGQIGVSLALGAATGGVGLVVGNVATNIAGLYLEKLIDDASKWPARDMMQSVGAKAPARLKAQEKRKQKSSYDTIG